MRRWEDNIKMNIKGLGCEGVRVNWRAIVNAVIDILLL
jgi:hypothetical protein